MGRDAEREEKIVVGYASLAAEIARDEGKSAYIYRRFARISARNLLYLQSQLATLETQLQQYDDQDLQVSTDDKKSARNWELLSERAKQKGGGRENERLDLIDQLSQKIKEYLQWGR